MAGIILADSFAATQPAAESRVRDKWRGRVSLPTRRRRRRVAPPLHGSRAALGVTLDGDSSPAAAGNRLLLFSRAGIARGRRSGCRVVLSARGRTLGADTGFMSLCGRVDKLLDASGHVRELIRPSPFNSSAAIWVARKFSRGVA